MQTKYKRILILIGLLIGTCIFTGIAYLFYDKVISDNTEVVVEEELSINFNNGYVVTNEDEYQFTITNSGSKDINYAISYTNMKGYNSKLTYTLLSEDANINLKNIDFDNDSNVFADNITIKSGETQNYILKSNNLNKTTFTIRIKKTSDIEEYFASTILKTNIPKKNTLTKVGEEIATTDEGLIEDIDDFGTTYYFRGDIKNNYVKIDKLLWRIVRINGDGTIKLVLNMASNDLANYHSDILKYEDLANADITKLLNSFYEVNLKNYDNYITNSKYCVESFKIEDKNGFIYAPYTRLITNNIPSFNCLGDNYSGKIGILTADEVVYAGANFKNENKSYYLYNSDIKNIWWTSSLAKADKNNFYPFSVNINGKIVSDTTGMLYRNIRPSINIVRKTMVNGDGTLDNPYEIITD